MSDNRMRYARWITGLAVALSLSVSHAQTPPPGALLLGPTWRGQSLAVRGTVIAQADACRQIAVDRMGVPGAGGRLWVCARRPLPGLGQRLAVHGTIGGTRLTRMGNRWRVVPVVDVTGR